jgi:putative NADH-flavin reductase
MKILVVGAAGKTGTTVVEQALAAGHEVTAFVHHADGYDVAGDVRVVAGDAADGVAISHALSLSPSAL